MAVNPADYKSVTPGASPDNPIVTPNQYAATAERPQGTSPTERELLLGRMKQQEDEKREKINKKEEGELKAERDKQEKEREKRNKAADKKYRRNAGMEIPKQGLHRFGHAGEAMTSSKGLFGFSMSPSGEGYQDAFSGGSANIFGSSGFGGKGRKSAGSELHVDFGRTTSIFGGFGNAMKKDGKAKGFGGYQDPFAGSSPIPKIGKGKRGKKSKGKPSLGGSIFNLRLF